MFLPFFIVFAHDKRTRPAFSWQSAPLESLCPGAFLQTGRPVFCLQKPSLCRHAPSIPCIPFDFTTDWGAGQSISGRRITVLSSTGRGECNGHRRPWLVIAQVKAGPGLIAGPEPPAMDAVFRHHTCKDCSFDSICFRSALRHGSTAYTLSRCRYEASLPGFPKSAYLLASIAASSPWRTTGPFCIRRRPSQKRHGRRPYHFFRGSVTRR